MSLVAYAVSGSEEEISDDEIPPSRSEKNVSPHLSSNFVSFDNKIKIEPLKGLYNLPPPKKKSQIIEVELEEMVKMKKSVVFPTKKKDGPVKIALPALPDVDSDEDIPKKKKIKPSLAGSGLFALLPEPKNIIVKEINRPLIPHSISKKSASSINSKQNALSVKNSAFQLYNNPDDEDEEEEPPEADFFSLSSTPFINQNISTIHNNSIQVGNLAETVKDNIPKCDQLINITENASNTQINPSFDELNYTERNEYSNPIDETSTAIESYQYGSVDITNDKEFKKLQGKNRNGNEEITFIDVNADDQIANPEISLTQSLSIEKEYRPSRKKGELPTSQQRKKHQITYLAFQAKERELELKNQWSQNRLTRKQTQSKYGF